MTSARIAIPAEAQLDEIVEIKTLITHPMETGFRPDALGRPIPRNILTRFECRFEGELVFAAEFNTGVAANPYLSFFARVPRSGTFEFLWVGEQQFEHRERRAVSVAAA